MGSMSVMHWMVLLVIVLILFGAGRLPRVMGDFAKGIKAFKSGMQEEEGAASSAASVSGSRDVATGAQSHVAHAPTSAYPSQPAYTAQPGNAGQPAMSAQASAVHAPAAPPSIAPHMGASAGAAPQSGVANQPPNDYRTGSAA